MGLKEMAEAGQTVVTGEDIARARVAARRARETESDVPDSGIKADLSAPVHVAWTRVMAEVEFVKKTYSQQLKYAFRGIDAVLNTVGPMLRKHGVTVLPIDVTATYERVTSKNGASLNFCKATVRYYIMGPCGDFLSVPNEQGVKVPVVATSLGEAFDTGDKASTKAQSVALREFYVKAFAIPTEEPERDPEHGVQHELAAPERPTAQQYEREILDEATTIARLQQIKAELDADPALGHATVEGLDGQMIELGRLVRRVGAARIAARGGDNG